MKLAFIDYVPKDQIDPADRIDDDDNILRIHGIHSRVMWMHFDFYIELMHHRSPLSRSQREMIATMVSAVNGCEY